MPNPFDWQKAVRSTDPDTSEAAAKSMTLAAGVQHTAILMIMTRARRPMAAEQIADRDDDNLNQVAVNRRLSELERAQLVIKTDQKHTNRSGRSAYKYRLPTAAERAQRDG
ncbi:MAG: hypothetical protein EHM35_03805 [Planctomycetaceae bacterium]|nr:MAG: hypothetical protein EHM35_03805 [Planctomycetaceae bacterium]